MSRQQAVPRRGPVPTSFTLCDCGGFLFAANCKVMFWKHRALRKRYRVCLECGARRQTIEMDRALFDRLVAETEPT